MKRDSDLTPLPRWKQRRAAVVAWWRRSRNRRQEHYRNLTNAARVGLTLAISMLGAMLVSYGVWSIYAPAGFMAAGVLLWAVQWNYGDKEGEGEPTRSTR